MRKQKKSFWALTFFLTLITTAFFLSGTGVGGELEPPDTVPTMPTLENIHQGVKKLLGLGGYEVWDDNIRFAIYENDTPEDPSDDVVWDRATNLMWARDANIAGQRMNWNDVTSYCNYLELAGMDDWRLPTLEELASLAEAYPSPRNPALPAGHPFVNVQSAYYYWSATIAPDTSDGAWIMAMGTGWVDRNWKSTYYYVWPVRGGQ